MELDFVCILLSEIGTHLRTEHSRFESSAQTLQSSLCFFFLEAFSIAGAVIVMEATQFTTQHNRFKTRRNGLSIDCVVDSVVDSMVD